LRIRADEHVSPEIARAVREMALSPGWELSHVLEIGEGGSKDEHWITRFSKSGGAAILSADTDFLKSPPQVVAVFRTGVKVIHLPAAWANSKAALQAAHILLWWDRIERKLSEMNQRECWRPPWNLNVSGELRKIDVDFQEAQKKLRKANRRSK